ncbi:MAG: AAA family ATPase [Tepidisphaerales bacterium]
MLREFTVDNYKSLINVTFKPHAMNLLLGLNNAGKTTLCQALKFASMTTQWSLDQCADFVAGGRVGITNFFFAKPTVGFTIKADVPFEGQPLTFEYQLTISAPTSPTPNPTLEVESEKLSVTGGKFNGVTLLENTRHGVRLLHEGDFVNRNQATLVQTTAPRDVTMLNRLYELDTNARANTFKKYLASWQYYALSPDAVRGSLHRPNETSLNSDGGNLASVIYRLKTIDERSYRKLLEYVRKIEPAIDVINFHVASENNVFMFFEDSHGHRLPASNASAGTLRYLALVYVLLVQPSLKLDPLIIIEEPENGVYVGNFKDALALVDQGTGKPQIIFTTHSPYFIDLFDTRLDSLFFIRRTKENSILTQPDVEKVRARLADFPLGEQHYREMLG